jgi:hypothetical protein
MAVYDILFPVRRRVLERFSRAEIEQAAQVAFWQHPPDDCEIRGQDLVFTWLEDLLNPGDKMIRISGDVIPPAAGPVPDDEWRGRSVPAPDAAAGGDS